MKKTIIIIINILIIICSLFLIAIYNRNNSNNTSSNNIIADNNDVTEYVNNAPTIEIRGIKYKDINSIPNIEKTFNNDLVYAESIREGVNSYVKLSDNFFIEEPKNVQVGEFDSEKRITQIEMLPSKIYSSEDNSNYLYTYNGETYFIPVEKCKIGEERIVYKDYGLELIKKDDSIKIKDKSVGDVISGWDLRDSDFSRIFDEELRYDDVSLCEAYMESWKISDKKIAFYDERDSGYMEFEERILEPQYLTHIYQVDFDDDNDSLEFIYTCGMYDHVHIDSTCPCYSIVTYSDSQGIKNYDERMLWFDNILNYKNVFYGFDAFEYGPKIDNLIMIKERVITGYYIFDKEQGLIHVDRFANGEKFDDAGFKKLSEIALTLDGQHVIKKDENEGYRIDAFPMYDVEFLHDENGDIVTNEDGSPKVNPNSRRIEDGTKIYINYISDDGYSFRFRTEDGTEYTINYYYV